MHAPQCPTDLKCYHFVPLVSVTHCCNISGLADCDPMGIPFNVSDLATDNVKECVLDKLTNAKLHLSHAVTCQHRQNLVLRRIAMKIKTNQWTVTWQWMQMSVAKVFQVNSPYLKRRVHWMLNLWKSILLFNCLPRMSLERTAYKAG